MCEISNVTLYGNQKLQSIIDKLKIRNSNINDEKCMKDLTDVKFKMLIKVIIYA